MKHEALARIYQKEKSSFYWNSKLVGWSGALDDHLDKLRERLRDGDPKYRFWASSCEFSDPFIPEGTRYPHGLFIYIIYKFLSHFKPIWGVSTPCNQKSPE